MIEKYIGNSNLYLYRQLICKLYRRISVARKAATILGIIFGIIVLLIIGLVVMTKVLEKDLNALKSAPIKPIDVSAIPDGKYYADYQVSPIRVKLDVYVQEGKISKIDLIEHKNGKGKPAEAIVQKVIDSQKIDIDSISGATYSSMVIKKAIEMALDIE